jgi:excisionase family DNA binding protein
MSKCMTVPAAAAHFGVSRNTIYNWLSSGILPHLRLPGGQYRIREHDIEEAEKRMQGGYEWQDRGRVSGFDSEPMVSGNSSVTTLSQERKSGFRAALAMNG